MATVECMLWALWTDPITDNHNTMSEAAGASHHMAPADLMLLKAV